MFGAVGVSGAAIFFPLAAFVASPVAGDSSLVAAAIFPTVGGSFPAASGPGFSVSFAAGFPVAVFSSGASASVMARSNPSVLPEFFSCAPISGLAVAASAASKDSMAGMVGVWVAENVHPLFKAVFGLLGTFITSLIFLARLAARFASFGPCRPIASRMPPAVSFFIA